MGTGIETPPGRRFLRRRLRNNGMIATEPTGPHCGSTPDANCAELKRRSGQIDKDQGRYEAYALPTRLRMLQEAREAVRHARNQRLYPETAVDIAERLPTGVRSNRLISTCLCERTVV